jgi:hypothetical protein
MGQLQRRTLLLPLLLALSSLFGCAPRPPEFREVGLEEARTLVQGEGLTVVEAFADPRRQAQESATPVRADGGVLVFGLDAKAARARAATFARAGHRPVLVFIPKDADERGRFYAAAGRRQEDRRGKDS